MPHDLSALPKAHLHLHLTGAMRHSTMIELARAHGSRCRPRLPRNGLPSCPPPMSAAGSGSSVSMTPRARCSARRMTFTGWCGRSPRMSGQKGLGGLSSRPTLPGSRPGTAASPRLPSCCLTRRRRRPGRRISGSGSSSPPTGPGIRWMPGRWRGWRRSTRDRASSASGSPTTSGAARPRTSRRPSRIAERAGLLLAPHAGELVGPASVRDSLDLLHADRLGHGVRSVEDPRLVERLAAAGVTCEVCPSSNVSLGVAPDEASVPVRTLVEAGVPVALGADDPLLFGRRLVKQYEIARDVHGFDAAPSWPNSPACRSAAPPPRQTR